MHVFGRRDTYPLAESRRYTPGVATVRDLTAMLDRLGLDNAVIVQASPFGNDHACLIDALDEMGGRCVGVAGFLPHHRPADATLDRLAGAGVIALRVHTLRLPLDEGTAAALHAASLAQELGWHLEMQIARDQLTIVDRVIRRDDVAVVLDHMGHAGEEDLPRLIDLARTGQVYIKLSGFYRQEDAGPALQRARHLLEEVPERCVWGSDWPHTPAHPDDPEAARTPLPFRTADAGADIDGLFGDATGATLDMVLRATPAQLYTGPVRKLETQEMAG